MPTLTRPYNPAFPSLSPQIPPSPPNSSSKGKTPETWDYGFKRLVPFLQSPPVGAGILAITFFFFIAFFSNVLLAQISLTTLGIAVTLSTFGILALVVLILFLF
ncbi:hypothetical protein [Desulfosporosinus metallidurans]|uniref:Uncharacterized protein n=1 Tax=Desulfosporosinus metallidurans TaxID=1888891 RepID=A0A1Q8QXU6_9FIRM|nr:hypothetical protein [Desulfosporosinus metallidurans]OLN32115.1 hypothetical protein DSOL_1988 [Desulfosporosinus metallidurans]